MYITKENFKRNNINLIQFIMAISVIYSHAFPVATGINAGEIINDLTASRYSFGNLAVATFFIFSGFLVSASYENSPNVLVYLRKRIFRIFPGLVAVLVVSAFVLGPCVTTMPVMEYYTHPTTRQYLKNVFLIPLYWNLPGVFEINIYGSSVNGSLWTIPYQFCFYILLGIIGFLGLHKRRQTSLVLFIFFTFSYLLKDTIYAGRTHFLYMPLNDWLYLGMYFSAGMVAYTYKDMIRLSKQNAMIALSLLVFAWSAKEYFISTTILGTYLLLYLSYGTKVVKCPLARLSFGIYIYGFPVQQLFTYLAGGRMDAYLNTLLSIPTVLVLAWLSDKYIEAPIQKLEKYLTVSKFIPRKLIALWTTCYNFFLSIVEKCLSISWKAYFIILTSVLCALWYVFVNLPSGVIFSSMLLPQERICGTGYYPRQIGESYTFVSDVSEIYLGQKKGMTELTIEGFLPGNFTDVQSVSVFVNDIEYLTDQALVAGEGFSFTLSIADNETNEEKKITIKLVFDAIHEMEEGSMDVRDLSACITAVRLRKPTL